MADAGAPFDTPGRKPESWLEPSVLLGLLGLIAIQALYPLLQVGLITNDDLKFNNAILDRGFNGAVAMLWAFTRRDGRLDIAQIASWYLPFAFDSFLYFKAVCLAAIVADLVLFGLFVRSVLGSPRAFYLALLIGLVGLQDSWEHTPIVAFPGLFTITFAYLLGSFLAFQRYLAKRSALAAVVSAVLFFVAICSYEMYLLYFPLFVGLALLAGRTPARALRATVLQMAAVVLQLGAWVTSHTFRTGNYPGVTVAPGFELERVAHVVWQFSVSSLPTYFFYSAKYDYLLDINRRISGLPGLLAALSAGSVAKALLAGALFVFLMTRRETSGTALSGRRVLALVATACVYFFAPSILPGLTERYQEEVKQQLGMQCSYFSLFAVVFLVVTLLLVPWAERARRGFRWTLTATLAGVLMWTSVVVDYTNGAVAEWQARGRDRLQLVESFVASPAYMSLPNESILYAPSLFRSIGTINYVGAALDPIPSQDWRYENFWTFYIHLRGGKRIAVTDRLERVPARERGVFYLRTARPGGDRGQYLVFAYAERGKTSPDLLLSSFVHVYDRTTWPASAVGGSLAETDGAPVAVGLVEGAQDHTSDRFLFDIGNHYLRIGTAQRSAVQAERAAIDVDSVFLAPRSAAELRVLKTTGWFEDGWIGSEADAILPLRARARLIVDAFAPDYIFKKLGVTTLTFSLEIDGTPVATRAVTQGGRIRIESNVGPATAGHLALRCGPTHRPTAIGILDDPRELCAVIERVVLRPLERGE